VSKRHSERFSKTQNTLDLIQQTFSSWQAQGLSPEQERRLLVLAEFLPLPPKTPPELAENVKNSSVFVQGKLKRSRNDGYEVDNLDQLSRDVAFQLWLIFRADLLKEEVLFPFFDLFLTAFELLETMALEAEVKPKLQMKGKEHKIELSEIRQTLESLMENIKSKLPIKKLAHHDAYEIAKLFQRHVPEAPALVIANRVSELLTKVVGIESPSIRTLRSWLKE
jgi:hypothetical protein